MDEMKEIIICKHCGEPEYYGEMMWLNGFCGCRSCYKSRWQEENHKLYSGNGLDGERPTLDEYYKQCVGKTDTPNCFVQEKDNPYSLCIGRGFEVCTKCQIRNDWEPDGVYE